MNKSKREQSWTVQGAGGKKGGDNSKGIASHWSMIERLAQRKESNATNSRAALRRLLSGPVVTVVLSRWRRGFCLRRFSIVRKHCRWANTFTFNFSASAHIILLVITQHTTTCWHMPYHCTILAIFKSTVKPGDISQKNWPILRNKKTIIIYIEFPIICHQARFSSFIRLEMASDWR